MLGGIGGFQDFARRLTRSADAIRLPKRHRAKGTMTGPATGPVLVRGRGLARRRPGPLTRLFRFLFG